MSSGCISNIVFLKGELEKGQYASNKAVLQGIGKYLNKTAWQTEKQSH